MQVIKPEHYNATGIDCKTFWVTEYNGFDTITYTCEYDELINLYVARKVVKAIQEGKSYLNLEGKHSSILEIQWD